METRSEHHTATNGAAVEVGIVEHCGREFSALGSVVDHERGIVVGYVKGATLTTWDGKEIGRVRCVSTWRTPRSWMSSTMSAYRATVDGQPYHGRGCGEGMVLRLRRCK